VAAGIAAVLAVASAATAYTYQREISQPVGEGQVFAEEAEVAVAQFLSAPGADEGVRRVRNQLGIEAVGLVDPDGAYLAATSPALVSTTVDPFLIGGLGNRRLAALAVTLDVPLSIDGVETMAVGEVVYQVETPLADGSGLVLSYDISELFERRLRDGAVRPLTLLLTALALLLTVAAAGLLLSREAARRRITDSLRHAEELQRHNRELDEARQQAERALDLAQETNRIRSEFVLMINHELRTPLTGVVTGAELLLSDRRLSEFDQAGILRDIVRDGERLKMLIDQILTVARIENRGLNYRPRRVPVAHVLRTIETTHGNVQVELGAGGMVLTDPEALAQLLMSLADNAFTHGAHRVRISAASPFPLVPNLMVGEAPAEPLWFLVEDDGPGIEPEFLPRAFEKFEKRGFTSGTGLGLYMARLMAEALGACIAVRTGPSGTTMGVGVPAEPAVQLEAVPA
jgi:signal transduction histidine kinase